MRSRYVLFAALFLCPFVIASCGGSGGGGAYVPVNPPGDQSNDHLNIINDDEQLKSYVHIVNVPVVIEGPAGKPHYAHDFDLTLVAEIDAPEVNDQVLQATCVVLKGNKAIVSYNMRGATYYGGLQLIKVSDQEDPELKSQATFDDADVHAVDEASDYVYATLSLDIYADGNEDFDFPAVCEKIKIKAFKLVIEDNVRVGLESFAATGVCAEPGNKPVYVTTGDTGGVYAVKKADMTVIDSFELSDARWVDKDGDYIVVAQGGDENGVLSLFDWDDDEFSLNDDFDFDGANVAESKTTVEIAGDVAIVAAGPEGVKIISLADGTELGSVDCPEVDGLDEEVVVANAASVKDKLMFISFGEAGVYVVQANKKFKDLDDDEEPDLDMLGHLKFDDLQSVNHVEYKGKYLFIASGLGGLKIVEVED